MGDSHLARVRRSLAVINAEVRNLAVGGSTVVDLETQLRELDDAREGREGIVNLSIGTNDAAPWRGISVDTFANGLAGTLTTLGGEDVIYLAPPGVVEERLPADAPWTNAAIDDYRSAALDVCRIHGAQVIRADDIVKPFGPNAFSEDGVHLSGTGYRALLPVINTLSASENPVPQGR
ncbi:lysophospholipase L1-like esterase [Rudaeicoccus suwonensis]|uniref:Lysophospholipase L1-like esterase n=2 Tax=Rudaeicoccus suwonensis TaxID=657409 RepID=A0A561E356_9MICO|nr:lysophospholipase L1-like esterase [Rudaeicoccus suwonensis]